MQVIPFRRSCGEATENEVLCREESILQKQCALFLIFFYLDCTEQPFRITCVRKKSTVSTLSALICQHWPSSVKRPALGLATAVTCRNKKYSTRQQVLDYGVIVPSRVQISGVAPLGYMLQILTFFFFIPVFVLQLHSIAGDIVIKT